MSKWRKDIVQRIISLEDSVRRVEKRLTQVQCPHNITVVKWENEAVGRMECASCGYYIGALYGEEVYEAKIAELKEKLARYKKRKEKKQ